MHSRFTILLVFIYKAAFPQYGCTDAQATNYDTMATINDGSCTYPPTTLSVNLLTGLTTPLLDESSGLMINNGDLWTHVDNNDHSIYRIDSLSPAFLQAVSVNSVINTDWEDLASSNDHVFIGDFGNNYGNRTDLHILKIAKTDVTPSTTNVNAEIINFNYPDQTNFTSNLNNNPFDCEAFFFFNDSLHLFTKDWVNKITKHYILPAIAGTYTAQLVDSFNVNGLITSAAIQNDGVIALLGYDNTGFAPCFIWMLYDYQSSSFFSGNKRMFTIGSAINLGQVEGIDFLGNNYGYITNERFQQLVFNIPPQLKSFDLSPYLPSMASSTEEAGNGRVIYKAFPVPSGDLLNVTIQPFEKNSVYSLIIKDLTGKTIMEKNLSESVSRFSIAKLQPGIYEGKFYLHSKITAALRIAKN